MAKRTPRGALSNPENRFERLRVDLELSREHGFGPAPDDEAETAPKTVYLRDPTRQILAKNQSPDVPFDVSVNPYRGCTHGCVYCLTPDTPVLDAAFNWRPIGELQRGDELVGFDESPTPGRNRKLRKARVERIWHRTQPTLRVTTRTGTVTTTDRHRWLTGGRRWRETRRLVPGQTLSRVPIWHAEEEDQDYRAGYVTGMSAGDGTFRYQPGQRSDKLGFPPCYWRVALKDREPLVRLRRYLEGFGVQLEIRPFDPGPRSTTLMQKVETRRLASMAILHRLLGCERPTRSYRRGFVSGFFDAEGHNGRSLRFSQVDVSQLERVQLYAKEFGFEFKVEEYPGRHVSSLRLVGSFRERMEFFGVFQPAIRRKADALFGLRLRCEADPIENIEHGSTREVVDIQTSTRTFFAGGLATHNCFARPTHEYLGFSAGLDFETRILVKDDAPKLLRKALLSPRHEPRLLGLSGVTDPYQPVEAKLRITRGILEVLAEFRHPVGVITKNFLVTRDIDVLAALAEHRAVSVKISITTLDASLQRKMEPGTSRPSRRLAAVERLAAAGIPVGVMVAPIIPGLTDHEVPAILQAAAAAGADSAGRVLLRLPHGLKELFDEWLEAHFPARRAKVMNRMLALHDGQLYRPGFGVRQRGGGVYADQITAMFDLARRKAGLAAEGPGVSADAFRRPGAQLALFQ